jgi:hypothetical protein
MHVLTAALFHHLAASMQFTLCTRVADQYILGWPRRLPDGNPG